MTTKTLTLLGALGLALTLSACVPGDDQGQDADAQPQATVTVTETASAPTSESTGQEADGQDEPAPSASEGSEGSEGTEPAEEPEDAAEADGLSARGNIPKQIGEPAALTASSGGKALEFSVTGIEPNAQCTSSYAETPENEMFVRVDIEATTGTAEDMEELFYSDSMMFNPYDWKFVDSSGRTANDIGSMATYMCLDTGESLPTDIGPGENVGGSLILDVTDSSGTLVYAPVYDSAGWEWAL